MEILGRNLSQESRWGSYAEDILWCCIAAKCIQSRRTPQEDIQPHLAYQLFSELIEYFRRKEDGSYVFDNRVFWWMASTVCQCSSEFKVNCLLLAPDWDPSRNTEHAIGQQKVPSSVVQDPITFSEQEEAPGFICTEGVVSWELQQDCRPKFLVEKFWRISAQPQRFRMWQTPYLKISP